MRKLLREITEVVQRATAPGAALNAQHEVDRAASSLNDLDVQLRRVSAISTPRAA